VENGDSRDAVEKDKDGMIDRILKRASDRLVQLKNLDILKQKINV